MKEEKSPKLKNHLTKKIRNILAFLISLFVLFLSFKYKAIIYTILFIVLFIITIIIISFYHNNKKSKEKSKKAGFEEEWNDLYGEKISNILYAKDDKIKNSFKKDGENFNEIIGNVNGGRDYEKNERNYYNIFIPYSSLKRKDKYNRIILFIHGGAWLIGKKENIEYLCIRYAKYGYITAEMSHTVLHEKYKEYSMFRILDEVTSCIQSIKEQLILRGYDGNKLEIAIGGYSSGAHIALLYGYSMKNIPLPLKFLIDFVGPVTLEPAFWFKVKDKNNILDNIDPEFIEKAFKDGKLTKIGDDRLFLVLMHAFLGEKIKEEEIKEMIDENKKIKVDNDKYKKLMNAIKYTYPYTFINSKTVPTLCEYGGNDDIIGVVHYSILKKEAEKYGNKLEMIYMKKGDHFLKSYEDEMDENGLYSMKEMHYQILQFARAYFTKE